MKKLALMGLLLLVALFVSATVHAKPVVVEGTYCTEEYAADHPEACADVEDFGGTFTTKFFKEKFFGGRPGAEGNILMAKGQGFMLQNVELQNTLSCTDPQANCLAPAPCPEADWNFVTTYEGGMLTLNSKGPWLGKGMLKAKGSITATNYSRNDPEGNLLGFCMVITGEFKNAAYSFNAVALFDVTDDNYQFMVDEEDNPVFQRGYNFDAVIQIIGTP